MSMSLNKLPSRPRDESLRLETSITGKTVQSDAIKSPMHFASRRRSQGDERKAYLVVAFLISSAGSPTGTHGP